MFILPILICFLSYFNKLSEANVDLKRSTTERVITDYIDVLNGVPVDFNYNESNTGSFEPDKLISVPGCPKSELGIPWVYYGNPPRCYLAGEQGRCGINQILFIRAKSPFGICNCECFGNGYFPWFDFEKLQICEDGEIKYVFDPESKKCFQLYDQGPCERNQWLVMHDESSLCCVQRECQIGQIPRTDNDDTLFATNDCHYPTPHFDLEQSTSSNESPIYGVLITPNSCLPGTVYSKLLQKCIQKKAVSSVIG